ncbi:hypothetical protein HWI79_2601 [Cryptosporidium felis]|nr:hypothetical protein HWI79_2601 [Cryptosporidium felis]
MDKGTPYAKIECSDRKKKGKKSENSGKEIHLFMPFSIKLRRIKLKLRETEEQGLYSARVSKNETILSGRLIRESKNIPSFVIFGKFQLVTAPCDGVLKNVAEIGKAVKKRENVFFVECQDANRGLTLQGTTTKPGLITKSFRENNSNVKMGEAITIVRNNWRILTSPCNGIVIYTDTPGLARTGTNIAIVICSENGAKRNIQATKSFMILENILPNPSIVRKKQPLIIVDTSKFNWESSDNYYDSDTIQRIYSPSNSKSNLKSPKCKSSSLLPGPSDFNFLSPVPPGVMIQNITSPCNGLLTRKQELKIGSKLDIQTPFAILKCNKKSFSFGVDANSLVLQNGPYEKLGVESINSYEPESYEVSKGEQIIQIMFVHNIKHHVIIAPCTGFGYTFNSIGSKVSKGKYFAAIQCKDEDSSSKTQKIKAVKEMSIVSSYVSFKKKFFRNSPLFIMVESNQ